MLKKYLSALIALILIITTVISISLVTAYATGDTTTPDFVTTTSVDTVPTTTLRNVTRHELEQLALSPSGPFVPGDMIGNPEIYYEAVDYAKEVLANPNATQEEINFAYYNIQDACSRLEDVGWMAAPFLSGDNDGDEEVTIKDATKIQMLVAKLITNLPPKGVTCCFSDVNFDFNINIKDATMVQCYVACYTDEATCGYTGQRRSPQYYYNNQYNLD